MSFFLQYSTQAFPSVQFLLFLGGLIFWVLGALVGLKSPKIVRWVLSIFIISIGGYFIVLALAILGAGGGAWGAVPHTAVSSSSKVVKIEDLHPAYLISSLFPWFCISFFAALMSRLTPLKESTRSLLLFLPALLPALIILISVIGVATSSFTTNNSAQYKDATCDLIYMKYELPELPHISCASATELTRPSLGSVWVKFESVEHLEKQISSPIDKVHERYYNTASLGRERAANKIDILSELKKRCSKNNQRYRNCSFEASPITFRLGLTENSRSDREIFAQEMSKAHELSFQSFEYLLKRTPVEQNLEKYNWASILPISDNNPYKQIDRKLVCKKETLRERNSRDSWQYQIYNTYVCYAKFFYKISDEVKSTNKLPDRVTSKERFKYSDYKRLYKRKAQYMSVGFRYGAENIDDMTSGFEEGEKEIREYIEYLNENYLVP